MVILIFVLLFALSIAAQGSRFFPTPTSNVWKGIAPLKTSRSDLERILGKPVKQDTFSFTYKTDSESIEVYFSKGNCEGSLRHLNGWNVPVDTVLELIVDPNSELRLKDPGFGGEVVVRFAPFGFVLQEKGVAFGLETASDTRTGLMELSLIRFIEFLPMISDKDLRCKGFPHYEPAGSLYLPDHSIGKDAFDGFDSLVSESRVKPADTVIYAVVYQADTMPGRDFDKLFATYQTRLYKKRGADPEKIRLLRGGMRNAEKFMIEVFYLSKDSPPPVPSPDYVSRE